MKEQISHNPDYKKIADSLSSDRDINDAYFYALKDAYEKNGYNPTENHIRGEAFDRYWQLADDFQFGRGLSSKEWDEYGINDFEEKYGTESDFTQKLVDAYWAARTGISHPSKEYIEHLKNGGTTESWNELNKPKKRVKLSPEEQRIYGHLYEDEL